MGQISKLKRFKYTKNDKLDIARTLQTVQKEIPSEFMISGARKVSENLNRSTITWQWSQAVQTELRVSPEYSLVGQENDQFN